MSKLKQLQRAAVGVAAVAVLGTLATTALAGQNGPYNNPFDQAANDPNTTNVPYLAWRGENLRMVKCFGTNDFNSIYRSQHPEYAGRDLTDDDMPALFGNILQTNVQLEDWSGYDTGVNTPKEVINGARTFLWFNARTLAPVICFQDTWASQKAGLGQFKLSFSMNLDFLTGGTVPVGAQVLLMQHQWLAGWMSLNAPTLDEVSSIKPTGTTGVNPEGLGDASGDGKFIAGDNWYQTDDGTWAYGNHQHPGELRATVKGTLPLGQDYSELGISDTNGNITLPDDWAKLAKALATDADPTNASPWMRWDIHDELVDEKGNTLTTTGGRSNNATDPVKSVSPWWDNTANKQMGGSNNGTWNGDASFSRILTGWHGMTTPWAVPSDAPTAGPFDPNYAEETLLPDGQLNAGDAPMPAARIDFAIAPNTDSTTSIDGVGSFVSVSKAHDYSMDYTGSNKPKGNLFAPFYSQYIPATSRDVFGYASGVDGALITNNFPGFLYFGNVQDWTAFPLAGPSSFRTDCRNQQYKRTTPGISRDGETGAQTVAVYTDEHGEARVGYLPGGSSGDDFYFDALNRSSGDDNRGCDLGGVKVLGTSNISAIARYPYQKVTDPDKPAKVTVTKTVYSLFDKHLSYYPKNYHPSTDNAINDKVIVAHAQDIQGKPYANETVCFTGANPDGSAIAGGFVPPATDHFKVGLPDGTTLVVNNPGPLSPATQMTGYTCTKTDSNGNAVFELTTPSTVTATILAYFYDEALFRTIKVNMADPSAYSDNRPLTPASVLSSGSSTTGAGSNGTTAPSDTQVQSIVSAAIAGGFGAVATPAATPATTSTITPAITPVITKTNTITKAIVKTKVTSLRLVRPAHGKAYLMIKVQAAGKNAKVVLSLRNSHNKSVGKITKTIVANKSVKISSSMIKLAVKRVVLISAK